MEIRHKNYKITQSDDRFNLLIEQEATIKNHKQAQESGLKLGDKSGKKIWVEGGFDMRLENVLKKIVYIELSNKEGVVDLKEFQSLLQKEYAEIKELLKPQI